ncbi:sugar phosphate isomerase/epimerase family protein [Planctomyces sp. SH-PL62]|uniref:sugar phosphate isomerase/epimerase family protein n=1 Tax=Planctomyces sp. SH-PL62 TaxID=1636152 RepID=UPI00078D75D3|nr:sugar phosphate isomerase/epimerase family protein [Planctomyces sp. SH-PL62]AMV38547.1 D-tagatose 3-epimerase [Planctomyces sp. SH-PL62]
MQRLNIDRRGFLAAVGGVAAGAALRGPSALAADAPKWKRAFMLGGLTKGPVLPTFKLLKEAGFEGVELISPNELDLKEVLAARDETGLVIHGVSGGRHWSDPLSDPDPAVVERGVEAIKQEFLDCKAYGGTTVLVVPAVVNKNVSYRQAWERSQAQIRKLIPLAEEAGVKIAVEEVWNKFLLSPIEFARYIDEFESPTVGAYFDVGNIVEYAYPQEWIRELGKRILKIHIKEYAKPKRFGYPLGEGEIDWPEVKQALVDVGYEGWITAEVGFGDLDAMKDVVARMNRLLFS